MKGWFFLLYIGQITQKQDFVLFCELQVSTHTLQ